MTDDKRVVVEKDKVFMRFDEIEIGSILRYYAKREFRITLSKELAEKYLAGLRVALQELDLKL